MDLFAARAGTDTGGATGAIVAVALNFFATAQLFVTEPWPPTRPVTNGSYFDFIVIGGGTAGSTLASRLSEVTTQTVLLIEAGPDPPIDSIIPALHGVLMGGDFDWKMTTVGDGTVSQALEDGSMSQPRGKVLGGSGSINDMVYARGFPIDYDEWAMALGYDWNWTNVLPFFKKTEHLTDENIISHPELMELHGVHGEIEVTGQLESTFETDQFLKAFNEVGFKLVKDMTNPYEIGAGRFSHTIKNGQRHSSLTALLNKAGNRTNLTVMKEAMVTKILVSNGKAYGVQIVSGNEKFSVYCKKEVIVSAGTFNTPKLLMLSGIGPKNYLRKMGIEVFKNLPVGQNLHDHVMVLNFIVADNGTCYTDEAKTHMDIIRYLYDRTGPYSYSDSMAAYMALNSSNQKNVPDIAFYPSCLPMGTLFYDTCKKNLRFKDKICLQLHELLKEHELISVAIVLLKPKSRGQVLLKSTKPQDAPLIYPGTFSNPDDLQGYPEAMNVLRSLANSFHFRRKNAQIVKFDIGECEGWYSYKLDKCIALATAMAAWHSVGTAAMGPVVDTRLRIIGVQSLRVVDASVMPTIIRGNTNAPVVMIAEKAAEYIKVEHLLN